MIIFIFFNYRTALGHQNFILQKLMQVQDKVKQMKETAGYTKKDELRKNVAEMNKVFPKVYRLPLRAANKFGNIQPSKCRVMSSKMAPLWLCFDTVRPAGQKYQVLFKCGDDLRQDQLVLQSLSLFDRIWQLSGMELEMIPYGCIATGEFVTDFVSIPDFGRYYYYF